MLTFWGVTLIDCNAAAVTCNVVEPETKAKLAVIVELPGVSVLAKPELLTVAILPSLDVQVTELLTSCVVKSLKVAVAVNCCVAPAAIDGLAGVTMIEETTALVTVTRVPPVMEPETAVTVALPTANELTRPLPSTVAMVGSEEFHVTEDNIWVLPSLNCPVAFNWVDVPNANEGEAGLSEIETSCAGSTLKVVVPMTDPTVALMVTVPGTNVVANPALSIETTVGSDELHVTDARSTELPSLNRPVATKDWVTPRATEAWSGERMIDVRVGALTVTVLDPVIEPIVAVIVVLPATFAISIPLLSIEATVLSDEPQVTCDVRSCELLSLQVPVALNCWFVLSGKEGLDGLTEIETSIGVTVKLFEPVIAPTAAVTLVLPLAIAVAIPEAFTVAMFEALEDQVAWPVMSLLEPSL
jgi:hypothetical protein